MADVLQPPRPSLKDGVPEGWSIPAIAAWLSTFDEAIQESAKEIVRLLQTSKCNVELLREAGARYGLPLNKLNKCPLKTLSGLLTEQLFRLHRALSTPTHRAAYIERADAIFATGLLHLTLLLTYPSNTHRSEQWRKRFRQLQILPHTYHYRNFLSSSSVYAKLYFNIQPPHRCYHQHGHFYIGSTAVGIPHREHNRRAKLKQLQHNVPVSAELSLRYWHTRNTIDQLHHHPTFLSRHLQPGIAIYQTPSTLFLTPCHAQTSLSPSAAARRASHIFSPL